MVWFVMTMIHRPRQYGIVFNLLTWTLKTIAVYYFFWGEKDVCGATTADHGPASAAFVGKITRRRHRRDAIRWRTPRSSTTITATTTTTTTTTTISTSTTNQPMDDGSVAHIRSIGGPSADVYGEMTAVGLAQMMCAVFPTATETTMNEETIQYRGERYGNDVFLDLGSGDGAIVLRAAQYPQFRACLGIELSTDRHAVSRRARQRATPEIQSRVAFVRGDAAGPDAVPLLRRATVVWCSNLLFNTELLDRLAVVLAAAPSLRTVVSLQAFPRGIAGMTLAPYTLPLEMSWTANKQQPGHPPLSGHPCCVYTRDD